MSKINSLKKSVAAKDSEYELGVPFLPDELPFNEKQKEWLGGFLAGLHSRALAAAPAISRQANEVAKPLTILFGSQTGNAESMAFAAAEAASTSGMVATVLDMDDADIHSLANQERLLVVTSTYGEGEMPDNAQALWDAVISDGAPSFANTFFSVLALGDTSYDGFCLAGKMWDERLAELGGQRIVDRVDCDVDYETPSQAWIDAVVPEISSRGSQSNAEVVPTQSAPKKIKSKFNKQNPLHSKLTNKRTLTDLSSSKEIVHFELSLEDSGEVYEAGDAIYVISPNRNDLVDEVLLALGASGDEEVGEKSFREALMHDFEIRMPSKELVAAIAEADKNHEIAGLLDAKDNNGLSEYLWGMDIVDLLKKSPLACFAPNEFAMLCKPLIPRAYSISSSINKHENEVHLTISSVRYNSNDRAHNGVCSTYLADVVNIGDTVKCYFAPNKNFSVPKDRDAPMIMVGPGTGIAPFRAFLEEREVAGADGRNWLFFGDRNANLDFIYEEELKAWVANGLLDRLDLAFSRDQKEKIYVQDRMIEHGQMLYEWLEDGAFFFVCGDASRMAKDVDKALHQVIETHGQMSGQASIDYVNALKKDKRYVRDVY